MDRREVVRIREICQEVDFLVSEDPGTADLEVLERYRLKMNDKLYHHQWHEAEAAAYALMFLRSGDNESLMVLDGL